MNEYNNRLLANGERVSPKSIVYVPVQLIDLCLPSIWRFRLLNGFTLPVFQYKILFSWTVVYLPIPGGSLRQLCREKTINNSFVSVDFVPSYAEQESYTMSKRCYFWYFWIGKWSEFEKNDARLVLNNFPSFRETSVIWRWSLYSNGHFCISCCKAMYRQYWLSTYPVWVSWSNPSPFLPGHLSPSQPSWPWMVITLMGTANSQLLKVSTIKALDIYFGMCFFHVFRALIEFAAVCFCDKASEKRLTMKRDAEKVA